MESLLDCKRYECNDVCAGATSCGMCNSLRNPWVIPSADEEAGEVPKAFVVKKPEAVVTADELMAYVAERVAPHKKIRRLEFIGQVPKSASGKILRRVLIEQERAR